MTRVQMPATQLQARALEQRLEHLGLRNTRGGRIEVQDQTKNEIDRGTAHRLLGGASSIEAYERDGALAPRDAYRLFKATAAPETKELHLLASQQMLNVRLELDGLTSALTSTMQKAPHELKSEDFSRMGARIDRTGGALRELVESPDLLGLAYPDQITSLQTTLEKLGPAVTSWITGTSGYRESLLQRPDGLVAKLTGASAARRAILSSLDSGREMAGWLQSTTSALTAATVATNVPAPERVPVTTAQQLQAAVVQRYAGRASETEIEAITRFVGQLSDASKIPPRALVAALSELWLRSMTRTTRADPLDPLIRARITKAASDAKDVKEFRALARAPLA